MPVSAQDMATEVKVTEAAPGIYMLEGANGWSANMGLMIGEDKVLLIDNGMPQITEGLLTQSAGNGRSPSGLRRQYACTR